VTSSSMWVSRTYENEGRVLIGPRASIEGYLRNSGATSYLGRRASRPHLRASGNCGVHSSYCALRTFAAEWVRRGHTDARGPQKLRSGASYLRSRHHVHQHTTQARKNDAKKALKPAAKPLGPGAEAIFEVDAKPLGPGAEAIFEVDIMFARAEHARLKTQREEEPKAWAAIPRQRLPYHGSMKAFGPAERIAEGCFRSRRIRLRPRRCAALR